MYDVLLTCPPMIGQFDILRSHAEKLGLSVSIPEFTQVVPEPELIRLLPSYDGWIIGDDPATAAVFESGVSGRLRAAMKWGVGTDNVDFDACSRLGVPISNTPGVFGNEVADVAMGYVLLLARQLHRIDAGVRDGGWPKPAGISLNGKRLLIVGYGDIGKNVARRATAFGMACSFYDPYAQTDDYAQATEWPGGVKACDFLVVCAKLTDETRRLIGSTALSLLPDTSYVVNVSRGPIIDEDALVGCLLDGTIAGAALDVFEEEPLPPDSPLRTLETVILGTHNGSNTVEAVRRVSIQALDQLATFLTEAV